MRSRTGQNNKCECLRFSLIEWFDGNRRKCGMVFNLTIERMNAINDESEYGSEGMKGMNGRQ